jgi:hypothetical protein
VSTYTIAPFGVQGFSTGDTSICMSTVLISVPVLTVVLTIARVSLVKEFSLKNSIHYCIETLPSRTCTYTSVRNNIVSAVCATAPSDWGLLGGVLSAPRVRVSMSRIPLGP